MGISIDCNAMIMWCVIVVDHLSSVDLVPSKHPVLCKHDNIVYVCTAISLGCETEHSSRAFTRATQCIQSSVAWRDHSLVLPVHWAGACHASHLHSDGTQVASGEILNLAELEGVRYGLEQCR
jgi:hypothetical protein